MRCVKILCSIFLKIMPICPLLIETRSSAVAERPRYASCYWIFCLVTQDHSKWHWWVGCESVAISISLKLSVCHTISEIFSLKKRRNLETGVIVVQGHWKWSRSIRLILVYLVLFLGYLTLNNILTLKSGLEVFHGHSNWYHSKVWVRFPIRLP